MFQVNYILTQHSNLVIEKKQCIGKLWFTGVFLGCVSSEKDTNIIGGANPSGAVGFILLYL